LRLKSRLLIPAGIIFMITGLVYSLSLSRTINSFDSAIFTTAAYSLGIVHAPGYPLYLLLGHLAELIPLGSIALRINLLSAFFGSLTIVTVFFCGYRLTDDIWSSAFAALILGLSRLFWQNSVITEVYTLAAFFTALIILLTIQLAQSPSGFGLVKLSFFFGLSLTHHISSVLLGPWLLFFVFLTVRKQRIKLRYWLFSVLFGLLPLIIYLYLPLRFLSNPTLNYVSNYFDVDLASLKGIIWMLTGRMFGPEMFGRSLGDGLIQGFSLVTEVWLNFIGIGILISLYGLYFLYRSSKPLFIFSCGSVVTYLFFYSNYNVIDIKQMILPVLVLLTPPMALGLHNVDEYFKRKMVRRESADRLSTKLIFSSLVIILITSNWFFVDRSHDEQAYQFAKVVMSSVAPNSLILGQWTTAPLLDYLKIIEKQRPDVTVVDRGLISLGIRDKLDRINSKLLGKAGDLSFEWMSQYIECESRSRPVYITEKDPVFQDSFDYIPQSSGIYLLVPKYPGINKCAAGNNSYAEFKNTQGSRLISGLEYFDVAEEAYLSGNYSKAINNFEKALSQDYRILEAYKRLGAAYFLVGDITRSKFFYEKVDELEHGS
jgi:hypothetical protein